MAASLIGILTAFVAFLVDIAEATVSDWKVGFCSSNLLQNREGCCTKKSPLLILSDDVGADCIHWKEWSGTYWGKFGIYVGFALAFGIIAGSVTMTTKANLPAVKRIDGEDDGGDQGCVISESSSLK